LARDPSAAVRREVAVALRDIPSATALPVLVELAKRYDGKDRAYLEALGIGADGKEDALWDAVVGSQKSDATKWSAKLANLTWRLHPVAAVPALEARTKSEALSPTERDNALVALAFVPHADAVKAVLAIAENKAPAMATLSTLALRLSLQRSESEWKTYGVSEHIREMVGEGSKQKVDPHVEELKAAFLKPSAKQSEIGIELAASRDGGMFLLGLAGAKKLAPAVNEAVAEAIFRNPDLSVRALASKYFTRPALDGVTFPPVAELLEMKGNAAHGKEIFMGPTAACTSCHEFGGQGRNVGPALTRISEKLPRAALYDAILNPSAGIAFGFQPYVVVTKDGTTYTGFIIADGETLVLKDAAGETRFIPAAQVTERQRQSLSLMPDNIALGMKPQDLVDLVEFLATSNGATATARPSKKKAAQ
jgi:putative heme-binding domain-containing protein